MAEHIRSEMWTSLDEALREKSSEARIWWTRKASSIQDGFTTYYGEVLPLRLIARKYCSTLDPTLDQIVATKQALENLGFPVFSAKSLRSIWRRCPALGRADADEKTIDHWIDVLGMYGGQCAISRCSVVEALDVCRISTRSAVVEDEMENSILLRADIARAFASDAIMICPDTRTIGVHMWACTSMPVWNEVARIPNRVIKGPYLRQKFEDAHNG
jgi:hypothetical protein